MMNVASLHDRPREKLDRQGVSALTDRELLAVIVGHGAAGQTALDLAEAVLALAGSVPNLTRLDRRQLAIIRGIGSAQAGRLIAAIELGRRTMIEAAERRRFRCAGDVAAYLLPQYGAHPVERCGVVLLDTRHRLIGTRLISVGSLDASLAHPREVFREALLAGAAAVVVFHNHPSGDPQPSGEDVALTRRLVAAGSIVGIDLLDHLILADARFCSLREHEWP
jgi:DNA repair protein RadC